MNKAIQTLEFNKIKERLSEFCQSSLGKQLVDNLYPAVNIKAVETRLKETKEAVRLLKAGMIPPLGGLSNISMLLEKTEKGMILEASELTAINDFLRACRNLEQFMNKHKELIPLISEYILSMKSYKDIEEEISYSVSGALVLSQASKNLGRIRRLKENQKEKIEKTLQAFLSSNSNKSLIQEFFISEKNGHYTIPIKSAYKNHVEGSIIETSSTGSTVFIEPKAISKLAGEMQMLEAEEMAEQYQILAGLTGLIYENISSIKQNMELMATYDLIFAKARYAISINAAMPEINLKRHIRIVNGRHPLLEGRVVPLNIEVGPDFNTLVITGPNAGGKTVTLKTVGLLILMTQCGLFIPADESSQIPVLDDVLVDIGDNQSIENALSTFSSHMQNLGIILKKSSNNTLVLIDEIGTGTDPAEGAAIAAAILEELSRKGSLTIATTHYGEIKEFAVRHPLFRNASVLFDKETLSPLYELIMGESGESNAFWIVEKFAFPSGVINNAKRYLMTNEKNKAASYITEKDKEKLQSEFEKNKQRQLEKQTLKEERLSSIEERKVDYSKGDRVRLLDTDEIGLVYEEADKNDNVTVYLSNEYKKILRKRLSLMEKAQNLYPSDYDLDTLFTDYSARKLDHDIKRGSKRALKKIQKDMRGKNR